MFFAINKAKLSLPLSLRIFFQTAVFSLVWFSLIGFAGFAHANTPKVLVSITPFHALVSGVMCGVGEPTLLVQGGASPHHYSLRPSEIQSLHEADIIFWAGPALESFLEKPLNTVHEKTKIIRLSQSPNLSLLPTRTSAAWNQHEHNNGTQAHHHTHEHEHELGSELGSEHDHHHGLEDMHFWLDPNNAIVLVKKIAEVLSHHDPEHSLAYKKNSEQLIKDLLNLDKDLKQKLKKIKNRPFLVFHDGYQYFENHYQLTSVGAVTLHPELPISLERLNSLRETIEKTKAVCIFSEPQFKPKLVESLVKETKIKTGVLDPLGEKTPKCAEGYFLLLNNLSNSLMNCLISET